MQTNASFARLGLDGHSDERTIKRAYARELKLIDQEHDAAGFQALRQAYELALQSLNKPAAAPSFAPRQAVTVRPRWETQPHPATPAPARPAAPRSLPRDAVDGSEAHKAGQAVFAAMLSASYATRDQAQDTVFWGELLRSYGADERLLNMDAHLGFEYGTAHHLGQAFTLGNEGLFMAARLHFGWDRNRAQLAHLRQTGAWLSEAIDEHTMYTQQLAAERVAQRKALDQLRKPGRAVVKEILLHLPHLRLLVERFPVWSRIVVNSERMAEWSAVEAKLPAWRRNVRPMHPAENAETTGFNGWWMLLALVPVITQLSHCSGASG